MKLQFFCPHWGSEHLSWDVPSGKPVADQWDLNSYLLEEFRRRYTTIA